ncbi:MAG: dihydrofolate reductase [Myxococcota bacterium]|nr:dihydrofolate reductase [Myxococcota bacterium]
MRVSIVVAVSENGVIGAKGGLPWDLPDDQKFFKTLTLGGCIIMGRGTHDSVGRLLPKRTTLIISRNPEFSVEGAQVFSAFGDAVAWARSQHLAEVFAVGGASVYAAALPLADRLYLTRVHAEVEGETRMPGPPDPADAGFQLVSEERRNPDERHALAFTFQTWERSSA